MNNSLRWGLVIMGVVALVLGIYYWVLPFRAIYPVWGWRYFYSGPRMFSPFPFFGLLILVALLFVIFQFLAKSSGAGSFSQKEKGGFCPFCGRDLRGSRAMEEESPESKHSPEVL